jgi:hypothetical protein
MSQLEEKYYTTSSFNTSIKLAILLKIFLNETYSEDRIGKHLSNECPI